MKRLFILFLVVSMLAGCGRKSIVGPDIEGQQDVHITQQPQQAKEKTEEKAEEGTNSVVDSVEQNIEGQDVPIQQQTEEKSSVRDFIDRHGALAGTGLFAVGMALMLVSYLKEPILPANPILVSGAVGFIMAGILMLPQGDPPWQSH